MKLITAAALFLLMTISAFPQTPFPLEPGVSREMARWRAAHYSDVRYRLNIALVKGAPLMKGEVEISVKLTEEGAKHDLILDWRTTQFQNDKDKPYAGVESVNGSIETLASTANEHITIPKGLLKAGENVIKIRFASPVKTSGAAVTRYVDKEDGAEYLYSLFVPSDASTAFPVFDQPDLKARFSLILNVESSWRVVSNERVISMREMDCPQGSRCPATYTFQETKPISTYVFAFAAGEFREFSDPKPGTVGQNEAEKGAFKERNVKPEVKEAYKTSGRPVSKIYVRKSQAEKFKQHAAETFRLNREAVKFLEDYFDYQYPFPKYDLVLIPEFPFGGMEHAGATFLRESSVIFPSEPTANDFISRANLIFHEAAHQWFGDTVTMRWFDDLWLKEGFAEFMAYKTLEKVLPEYNAWKAFYERNKPLAYLTDSTRGTTPIYQEIPNLSAAKSAYGNIVYRKAPSFLRQAEFYLGEKQFQRAARAFLKKHQYANAEWTDLVREFEAASGGQDLKDWANVWVKKRGMPVVRTGTEALRVYGAVGRPHDTALEIYLRQQDALGENGLWKMKTNVLFKSEEGETESKTVELSQDQTRVDTFLLVPNPPKGAKPPALIFPNYQDYGYGVFLLDEKSRAYVLKNIQDEKDGFLRSMMWGALWDSVREAELNPRDYVELAIKNISVEQDELTVQTILSRVSTAMNYYLPDAERERLAPRLEDLLIEKIKNAPTLGRRITFYRAFLNVASGGNARAVLKQILAGNFGEGGGDTNMRAGSKTDASGKVVRAANPAIPLRTKDRFDIVTRLLILGDGEAARLLAGLERTETSDEAKRYAYAAKAGIGSPANKAKFWNDFVNNKEISESWIEAAFGPFNSVRHADLTLPYLEKALAELPALKRNRKIFFVNGWLGAFIGGQKSEGALKVVNKFLADHPNLDRDLRLKILENADALERAVKIRAKF